MCLPSCPSWRKQLPPFQSMRPRFALSGKHPGHDTLFCPFLCSLDLQVPGFQPLQHPLLSTPGLGSLARRK